MYCSLIRLNLEYCTVASNSISTYQVQRIEKVQHRFLKFMYRILTNCNDFIDMDYLDLCDRYKLPTLKHRRDINDCLFLYKHLHNYYNLTDANPYNLYAPARRTRHAPKHVLHVPWSRIDVTRRGFVSRISTTYNGLHGKCDVFGAPSVHSFRRQVSCALSQTSL